MGNERGEEWWRGVGGVEGHGFLWPTLIRERKLQQEARWERRLALRPGLTVAAVWAGTSWRLSEVCLWWVDGSGRSGHDGGGRSRTYGLQGKVWLFNVVTLYHLHYLLGHFLLRRQKMKAVSCYVLKNYEPHLCVLDRWTGGCGTPLPPSEAVDGP